MAVTTRRIAQLDILVIATGLWFLAKFLRYSFPPLFDPLQGMFEVSTAAIGLAFTGFMLCYAAMQFPSGIFADRIGPVAVMAAGAVIAAVAALGVIVEAGFLLLVVAMLGIGTGTGLHKTVSITLLAHVYPHHTGRVLGVHETFGTGAGIIAPIAAIGFLGWIGWRYLFGLAGLAVLAFGILALVRIPRRLAERGAPPSMGSDGGLRRYFSLFRQYRFSTFVLATILFSFTYNGVVAFLPLYLVGVSGLSVETAGVLYSVVFAATIVQLATGELSDRIGRLRVLGGCLSVGVAGLVMLLVLGGTLALALAVLAFGFGSHGYRPVRDAYLTTIIPDDAVGGGLGLVRTLLMGAGAIAPATVGVIAEIAGFRVGFGLLAISLALATVCIIVLMIFATPSQTPTDRPAA